MPFSDYQEIADILLELNSPGLIDDIAQSRKEYEENRTTNPSHSTRSDLVGSKLQVALAVLK